MKKQNIIILILFIIIFGYIIYNNNKIITKEDSTVSENGKLNTLVGTWKNETTSEVYVGTGKTTLHNCRTDDFNQKFCESKTIGIFHFDKSNTGYVQTYIEYRDETTVGNFSYEILNNTDFKITVQNSNKSAIFGYRVVDNNLDIIFRENNKEGHILLNKIN